MRFIMIAAALLAALGCYAQSPLKPADLVAQASVSTSFIRYEPFRAVRTKRAEGSAAGLRPADVQWLEADMERLSQLQMEKPSAIRLALPGIAGRSGIALLLVEVAPALPGFVPRRASDGRPLPRSASGAHYQGTVEGVPGSLAAVSVVEGEIMGLISWPGGGNWVLGRRPNARQAAGGGGHVLYKDTGLLREIPFLCATSDEGDDYVAEQLAPQLEGRTEAPCVGVYLEVDYDIVQEKGGAEPALDFVTALFNQVAVLYANEGVQLRLSEVLLWDGISPYGGTNSFHLLSQFVAERSSFNGDLAHLLSYQASGGVAYLSGLCRATGPQHGFSSISTGFAEVPAYSYSVMVIAHELGHQLGSRHTHACVWNGDNTAIDDCAGVTEGSCPSPGIPQDGGTIMSYCHIREVGIDFTKGFGPQPGNVIRYEIAEAACLQACADTVLAGQDTCAGLPLRLELMTDQYALETQWAIRDTAGEALYQGGPYAGQPNELIVASFCLPQGCYTFEVSDSYGDGICCDFGEGYYLLQDTSGAVLATGGAFGQGDTTLFCLPPADTVSTDTLRCTAVDFSAEGLFSFGGPQDQGQAGFFADGEVLYLHGNAWKAIRLPYTVTPQTVLEFDFGSTQEGEIHGIGFDENETITASRTFRLFGVQSWGISDFANYEGGATWQHYTIPVGAYYTGGFQYLFFTADHDRFPQNGNSYFRNIRIHEGGGCGQSLATGGRLPTGPKQAEASRKGIRVFPNPAQGWVTVALEGAAEGERPQVSLFSASGQFLYGVRPRWSEGQWEARVDAGPLPGGLYYIRAHTATGSWAAPFAKAP
ncbi:M12 family metallo-peptidase [Phaeodactylibacter luteus]|uniref:Peptidase M12B domain-containing protein n=1 Tax=Phaeodactylibacter luteus TaxID=1564516 RepID=A0A5C6RK54_9BACT|nr:M12 family metallo-peptidase [Phaeodactylibacter luteus]TXB62080.1 hypothetical protein FRY97_15690 [Phaeodactylibacter luteus]